MRKLPSWWLIFQTESFACLIQRLPRTNIKKKKSEWIQKQLREIWHWGWSAEDPPLHTGLDFRLYFLHIMTQKKCWHCWGRFKHSKQFMIGRGEVNKLKSLEMNWNSTEQNRFDFAEIFTRNQTKTIRTRTRSKFLLNLDFWLSVASGEPAVCGRISDCDKCEFFAEV